ncbi:MAG: M50 family metallopeptidase [Archangium sp.]|nr:M50 family metallopeptidase [Archangium sp.]
MTTTQLHPGRAALLLGLVVAGAVFWHSPVLLPFKLLSVMGHETGHALASLIVGGSVDRVTLSLDESGACLSRIPDGFFARAIVFSAGYVGSAIISVLLLVLTFRFNARRIMLAAACIWLAGMGLIYARDGFTLLFALVMATLFGLGAKWLPDALVGALNIFIASFTSLYAVMDLKDDLWNSAVRSQSDAQLLADLTILPAIVWAALWTLVSVGVLLGGAWLALRDKPVTPASTTALQTAR